MNNGTTQMLAQSSGMKRAIKGGMILLLICLSIWAMAAETGREERKARRLAKRGCNGSAKMVGYGTPTWKVLRNNR